MQKKDRNADYIVNLPYNKIQPSDDDLQMIEILFNDPTTNSLIKEFMESIIIIILFIIVSCSFTDDLLKKILPVNYSTSLLLIIKGFILAILFWIFKNFKYMKT